MLGADRVVATRMVVRGRPLHAARSSSTPTARTRPRRSASSPTTEGYDLADCYAYSDSVTDLPMLEAVGHPYGGQPRPGAAQGGASARDWPVLVFTRPVRLRDRFAGVMPAAPS